MALFRNKKKNNTRPKCSSCGLYKEAHHPRFEPQGNGEKGIMFITPSPSGQQDKSGSLYDGEATRYFASQLEKRGINLKRDCWIVPATGCFTNRKLDAAKKRNQRECKPRLEGHIKQLKPKMIIALGGQALNAMVKGIYYKPNIATYEGRVLPDYTRDCWLGALPHPLHLVRGDDYGNCLKDDKYYMTYYDRMVDKVLGYHDRAMPPYHDIDNKIEIITDYRDVISLLKSVGKEQPEILSHDYETNTPVSFLPGRRLETISLAWNEDRGFAFPMDRVGCFTESQQNNIKELWRGILLEDSIGKVCHNMNLENLWGIEYFKLGKGRINWTLDTMVGVHMLCTEKGTKGLKYHMSTRYGITDYGNEIQPFLESPLGEFNNIHKANLNKLLHYNGIDSLGGYWLYRDVWEELGLNRKRSRRKYITFLYQNALEIFCEMYQKGFPLDLDFFEEELKYTEQEQQALIDKILNSREGKLFREDTGRDLEISNPNDIGHLLYKVLDITPTVLTATGKGSTAKEALNAIDIPIMKDIKEAKTLETYLTNTIRKLPKATINGVIHPECGVTGTRSGRTNSYGFMNGQNLSKRNPRTKKVRKGFVAPPGFRIGGCDYGSVEITTNALCSGDEALKNYIRTPGSDPHGESAQSFFMLPPEMIEKNLRQSMKANWMFLNFYKGHPSSAAKRIYGMWDDVVLPNGISLHDHMRIKGIDTLYDLRLHAEEQAEKLWERFPVFHEYQESKAREYFEKGYVSNPSGFQRNGYVTPNQSINTPAQNLGCVFILEAIIAIHNWLVESNMKSYLVLQIHDDIIPFVHEDETQEFLDGMVYHMTEGMQKRISYIDVPLKVDPELSPIGGNWYDVEPWEKDPSDGIWKPEKDIKRGDKCL